MNAWADNELHVSVLVRDQSTVAQSKTKKSKTGKGPQARAMQFVYVRFSGIPVSDRIRIAWVMRRVLVRFPSCVSR